MTDSNSRLSILVVDDSPDTVWSTSELLELAGCEVQVAFGGEEALALAAAHSPDVVLLDLLMPGMGGCEVARRLIARSCGKPPLLVAVTGCGTDADRTRSAAAGFDLHLIKPVDPALLVGVVRRFQRALAPTNPSSATTR
jgi:CheY-like chemotaxis protein